MDPSSPRVIAVGSAPDSVDVLVIDTDSESDRDITDAFAEGPSRARVHVSTDGAEAVAACHGRSPTGTPQPNIVLLDSCVQFENGTSVLEVLKADPILRALPTVVITASAAPAEIRRQYDRGANACLKKPIGADELTAVVQAFSLFWFEAVHLPPLDSYDGDEPSKLHGDGPSKLHGDGPWERFDR